MELPAEELRYEEKRNKTGDVNDAIDYLKSIFYHYATNLDRYNYTRDDYRKAVYADLDTYKKFVVTYYNEYNYDMTDEWDYDWTFPKALLFTITIMTTVGEYRWRNLDCTYFFLSQFKNRNSCKDKISPITLLRVNKYFVCKVLLATKNCSCSSERVMHN